MYYDLHLNMSIEINVGKKEYNQIIKSRWDSSSLDLRIMDLGYFDRGKFRLQFPMSFMMIYWSGSSSSRRGVDGIK